jgi:hypothetical protein
LIEWSFAEWKLGLSFKEIRLGISLNRRVAYAFCALRASLFCPVPQGNLGLVTGIGALPYRRILLEKEKSKAHFSFPK